jgi:hypothetical protein
MPALGGVLEYGTDKTDWDKVETSEGPALCVATLEV